MPARIHIIGRKNSGKTTLVCDLLSEFAKRGLKVGALKHTHHHHQLDTPGKDSYRHREAGAAVAGILAPGMNAVFWPSAGNEPDEARYARLLELYQDCSLVLVEGDSQTAAPKIEMWRAAVGSEPLAASAADILAVVSDDPVPAPCPVWPRSHVPDLADRLARLAQE